MDLTVKPGFLPIFVFRRQIALDKPTWYINSLWFYPTDHQTCTIRHQSRQSEKACSFALCCLGPFAKYVPRMSWLSWEKMSWSSEWPRVENVTKHVMVAPTVWVSPLIITVVYVRVYVMVVEVTETVAFGSTVYCQKRPLFIMLVTVLSSAC